MTASCGSNNSASGLQAEETSPYPEKAMLLNQWITEQKAEYDEADVEIKLAEATISKARHRQRKAEATAAGYHQSLCEEFGLKYTGSGTFALSDCQSF